MREWLSICADYVYRQVVHTIPRDRAASEEGCRRRERCSSASTLA